MTIKEVALYKKHDTMITEKSLLIAQHLSNRQQSLLIVCYALVPSLKKYSYEK